MSSTPSDPHYQGPSAPQDARPGQPGDLYQHTGPAPSGPWPQQGGQQYPPYQPYQGGYAGAVSQDERTMAMIAHLSTILALIVSAGWLSFVGPFVVWLLNKDRSPFVRESAAGAFNFNLGLTLLSIVGWLLTLTIVGAVIGIPMILIAAVLQVVMHIIGAVRANRGDLYRYPMQMRILS